MNIIKNLHELLNSEINKINELIIDCCASGKEELISDVSKYLFNSGGKRIRPILTILTSKLFNYNGTHHITLAASVELIHSATLLHDDVIDNSLMRRFKPTANSLWGNKSIILIGDFLFSQSFKLMVKADSMNALDLLSSASATIASGEVSALVQFMKRKIITQEEYYDIINAKTAQLFAAATKIGGIISGQNNQVCQELWHFGINLGNLFQIRDDVLDYYGDGKDTGKNTGDDFIEGKVTLPMILLHQKLPKQDQIIVEQMINAQIRHKKEFEWTLKKLHEYEVQDDINKYIEILQGNAMKHLNSINVNNQYTEYLQQLIEFVAIRYN
ncbi:MAG: polyprenyl synthetase family protein [Rickettsiaceae bacterium]